MKSLFFVLSWTTAICLFSCGTAPPTSSGDWRPYTSPDKSFSGEFPCEPKHRSVSATPTPGQEYGCSTESAEGLRFFTVTVWKSDFEGAKIRDEAALERSVKDSFTANHRIVKTNPIKIDGGIGCEVIVTNTRDDMDNLRGRVIIFGTHRFEVGYLATDIKLLESVEADRFFASFKPLR